MQLYFTAGIYCLPGKLTAVWNFFSVNLTEVNFTPPEVMQTLKMKLPHTEVKFYPELKSQAGLSSLRVSCERALSRYLFLQKSFIVDIHVPWYSCTHGDYFCFVSKVQVYLMHPSFISLLQNFEWCDSSCFRGSNLDWNFTNLF